MSQLYPRSLSVCIVIAGFTIYTPKSEALQLGRVANLCVSHLRSIMDLNLRGITDDNMTQKFRRIVDERTKTPLDPMDLATDETKIFDKAELIAFGELSPVRRRDFLLQASYFFSRQQLVDMKNTWWYSSPRDSNYEDVRTTQRAIRRQIQKFDDMIAAAPYFEGVKAIRVAHKKLFDFIQTTADMAKTDPFTFTVNFVEIKAFNDDPPDVDEAYFRFLVDYFQLPHSANFNHKTLSPDQVKELTARFQQRKRIAEKHTHVAENLGPSQFQE